MNLRGPRQTEGPDIILTPLIDTMFLLVIFFMLSATFSRHAEISVELPEASARPEAEQGARTAEIVIDARGRYYMGGHRLPNSTSAIKSALEHAAGQGSRPPLIISADADTPHHSVVTAMDAAQQAGFLRLSIATVQPP
jgi:biopolymer transport protein ExbD